MQIGLLPQRRLEPPRARTPAPNQPLRGRATKGALWDIEMSGERAKRSRRHGGRDRVADSLGSYGRSLKPVWPLTQARMADPSRDRSLLAPFLRGIPVHWTESWSVPSCPLELPANRGLLVGCRNGGWTPVDAV